MLCVCVQLEYIERKSFQRKSKYIRNTRSEWKTEEKKTRNNAKRTRKLVYVRSDADVRQKRQQHYGRAGISMQRNGLLLLYCASVSTIQAIELCSVRI